MSLPHWPVWFRYVKWRLFLWALLMVLFATPTVKVFAQPVPAQTRLIDNQAVARYEATGNLVNLISNQVQIERAEALIDPLGTLVGCDGQPLASYAGFSMALYEPTASGLDLGSLVALTPTQGATSIAPNGGNVNPFSLEIGQGKYNFLLDANQPLIGPGNLGKTQTTAGAEYILVINPPASSGFKQRRVRVTMLGVAANGLLSYRATSLDGQPIGVDGQTELVRTVSIRNAAGQGLVFFELGLNTALCDGDQIRMTKTADRSAVQPGDAVVYRLLIQGVGAAGLDSVVVVDSLPVGFQLMLESVSGSLDGMPVAIATQQSGSTVTFRVAKSLAASQKLEIIYVTSVTPDAIRGSGQNSALVTAQRSDNQFQVQDGPSIHRMSLDPGIFSDCGTLIGRVFEDKNFDGEQQFGEAGISNAVIFLDDGNRVVTDADGLFSLQKALPGQRTGTLDLSSLPGYTLAPNLYFNERNSLSRLVNLAPGGLGRMNFGVTPTFQEGQQ
ncbi:MAG: DUF11 domain-containing protein [Phormidesmis sp. RL_2_1]|nr:DUF11 domain-containing protein [Phormidesmis sp. RL_2_1]